MNVLVVGGAGYIGSVLCRRLLDDGERVTVYDRFLYGDASLDKRAFVIHGDVRDIAQMRSAMMRCDAVCYLAELVSDPICARFPLESYEVNELAAVCAVRLARRLGVPKFIYVSSGSVYGASSHPDVMLDEDAEMAPQSLYAQYKIRVEQEISASSSGFCVFRPGTVFGLSPRMRFDLLLNRFTAQAACHRRMTVFGGARWRPYVHLLDVADAVRHALHTDGLDGGVFNLVGENATILGLAEAVARLVPGAAIEQQDDGDRRNYCMSGERLKRAGFTPTRSIAFGIEEVRDAVTSRQLRYSDPVYHNPEWYRGDGEFHA